MRKDFRRGTFRRKPAQGIKGNTARAFNNSDCRHTHNNIDLGPEDVRRM
jgi:hypothetical protein